VPTIAALAGISRAPFLTLPVALVATATAAASCAGPWVPLYAGLALIGLLALHIAVDAINEASDAETGIDFRTRRTPFSGGSGTIPAGALSVRFAYLWGFGFAALGAGIGLWFLVHVGPVMLPILALGALSVIGYSHFLLRVGVGEAFAGLGLGALPVLGAALVHSGHFPAQAFACAIPAFLMTFNLLLLNEFPDVEADREGGRRHLVILLGARTAALVYSAAALSVPLSIAVGVWLGWLPALCLLACLPTLLLVPAIRWSLAAPESDPPIPALASNVIWNHATHAVLALTLVVACHVL
jgi:1,4-dihydroxy-2-naphthoate octaprenyltransferase